MESRSHSLEQVKESASAQAAADRHRERYDIPSWLAGWVQNLLCHYPQVEVVLLDRSNCLCGPEYGNIIVFLGKECYDAEGTQVSGIEQRLSFDPALRDERVHPLFYRPTGWIGGWGWSLEEGPPPSKGDDQWDSCILHGEIMGDLNRWYSELWYWALVLYDKAVEGLSFDWLADELVPPTVAAGGSHRRILTELVHIDDPENRRAVATRICEAKPKVEVAVAMVRRWRVGDARPPETLGLTDAVTRLVEDHLTRHPSMPCSAVETALRDAYLFWKDATPYCLWK